jgi:hypothetical protein
MFRSSSFENAENSRFSNCEAIVYNSSFSARASGQYMFVWTKYGAIAAGSALLTSCAVAQKPAAPTPKIPARQAAEKLGRGLMALRQNDGKVWVSWRFLPSDGVKSAFNLYRATAGAKTVRVNSRPLGAPRLSSTKPPTPNAKFVISCVASTEQKKRR